MLRPILAHEIVRFVGEPIVAILAETRQAGVDAAELVAIDYDPLPVVVDPEIACTDEMLLFPDVGTNIVCEIPRTGDDDLFEGCEVVVEARIISNRLAPAPMEPRVAAAVWDGTRLTQWCAGQGVFGAQGGIARLNGLDISQVASSTRCRRMFGASAARRPKSARRWLSAARTPVRWFGAHRDLRMRMAGGRSVRKSRRHARRRFLAYSPRVRRAAAIPRAALGQLHQLMRRVRTRSTRSTEAVTVLTNTTPVGAYRGAGRPEATAALERVVDMFAAEIGMDPGELRRRNVIAPGAFPYTTPTGAAYDSGEYAEAIDRVLDAAGYADLRSEQQARRRAGDPALLGIGMASYVEVTNPMGSGEWASVEVKNDGGAIVRSGVSSHGQGLGTAFVMLASDVRASHERMEYPGETAESRVVAYGDPSLSGRRRRSPRRPISVEPARSWRRPPRSHVDDVVSISTASLPVVGTPQRRAGGDR